MPEARVPMKCRCEIASASPPAASDPGLLTMTSTSRVVRQRELTAHAALSGLLTAHYKLMSCDRSRFELILQGALRDEDGAWMARDISLAGRIAKKYRAVYTEAVRRLDASEGDGGVRKVMERIYRMRLVVDYIASMTDEFALQSFQLISGVHVDPYRS